MILKPGVTRAIQRLRLVTAQVVLLVVLRRKEHHFRGIRTYGGNLGRVIVAVRGGAPCARSTTLVEVPPGRVPVCAGWPVRLAPRRLSGMSPRAEEVLALAMQLSEDERRELAERLHDSVSDGDGTELSPELREELIRRLENIEDGTAVLHDGDEVMRELRAKLAGQ